MIRFFDVIFSSVGIVVGFPLFIILYIAGLFDTGSPIFLQQRVGRYKKPFMLIKFRTMRLSTASVASHLSSAADITSYGIFLRKTKLDELPQLINVFKGDMSLVGPRPGLFNQQELTSEREMRGVFEVRPGITGLAQINHIDMSTPHLLAETDSKMINGFSIIDYFRYIILTLLGKGSGDRIKS